MLKRYPIAVFAAYCFAASVAAQTVTIIPAAPRYMEPVIAHVVPDPFSGIRPYGAKVSMAGNVITIVLFYGSIDIGVSPIDVELGRLPSGTYTVQVLENTNFPSGSGAQFTVADAPTPPNPQFSTLPGVPAVNYSDIWWNPSESGWGMTIVQGPTNVLYAVWFVYDASGKPTWYTFSPGQATAAGPMATVFTGPIYKTSGPYFGGPFDPTQVGITQVGTGILLFSQWNSGTFNYTVEGVTGSKSIVREPIE
jgi:hypothetical protein